MSKDEFGGDPLRVAMGLPKRGPRKPANTDEERGDRWRDLYMRIDGLHERMAEMQLMARAAGGEPEARAWFKEQPSWKNFVAKVEAMKAENGGGELTEEQVRKLFP